jgi:hypothetical protein
MAETHESDAAESRAGGNRLRHEKSPYLLQHADNPVDWYAWGDEAFEAARRENKPVFLSIGYSTCHWCHVMEHESFEDPEVARLMNEAFVCIKVDREERPDLDGIYMQVCQSMTGGGGWPLTILLTPDRKPFFAGTYFPKESRFGRMGMVDLAPRIREVWRSERAQIEQSANRMAEALAGMGVGAPGPDLGEEALHLAFQQLEQRYDPSHGGFGPGPKFPTPHNLSFLLRYWRRTGDGQARAMVERTLEAMRRGGLYDHIGFGFHRYSTDPRWLVPHFEKMLYDQAMLAVAYLEAFQATGRELFGQTAREIFEYVLRDMTAAEGGFFSAEDADSEGVEGKFYVWTLDEIRAALVPDEAKLAAYIFNIDPDGNYREESGVRSTHFSGLFKSPAEAGTTNSTRAKTGSNILHMTGSMAELARRLNMEEAALRDRLEAARRTLFAVRERRVHPGKDDKVLVDWNGLMIAALARGARVLDEPAYAEAAARAARFILSRMRDSDGGLLHRFREGEAAIPAFLDDHAFMIWGLLELYETTFDVAHLRAALDLHRDLAAHFWDEERGGFFFASDRAENLLVRHKEIYDGAVPSGNSVSMLNLLRLARITGDADLERRADRVARAFSDDVKSAPAAYTQLMIAVDFALGPSFEVVVAGVPTADDTKAMLRAVEAPFLPGKVVLFRPAGEESPEIADVAPFTRPLVPLDGHATAYVCRNHACRMPTTDVARVLELLESPARP